MHKLKIAQMIRTPAAILLQCSSSWKLPKRYMVNCQNVESWFCSS